MEHSKEKRVQILSKKLESLNGVLGNYDSEKKYFYIKTYSEFGNGEITTDYFDAEKKLELCKLLENFFYKERADVINELNKLL